MPGKCCEDSDPQPAGRWFKSSYSTGNSHCVEARRLPEGDLAVRDSKNIGPFLAFPASTWNNFVRGIKDGQFRSS